jgi:LysM domain
MGSLSAHLRQAGDHGRLRFHADCPVCREERLLGTLSSESVVSRRAQAALATGALAVSFAAPAAVSAQEPDSRQEGTVAPQEPGGAPQEPAGGRQGDAPAGSEAPGFDPGSETVLPFEVDAPQASPQDQGDDGAGEAGPLEVEPDVDPDLGLVPRSEADDPTASPGDEAPVAPGPPRAPPATEVPPPTTEASPERPPRIDGARKPRKSRRQPTHRPTRSVPRVDARSTTAPLETPEPAAQASPVEVPPPAQTGTADAATASSPLADARFHVVRPGESLWSIAKGLLGPGATMARIAREVARLWNQNEDRIATGDPDLLRVGTRLRLR